MQSDSRQAGTESPKLKVNRSSLDACTIKVRDWLGDGRAERTVSDLSIEALIIEILQTAGVSFELDKSCET